MSKVVNPIVCSISDFVTNTYNLQKKNILFWDTCALFEYITLNVPLVSLTNVPDISLLNVPLFTGCN